MATYNNITSVISEKIYPKVADALDKNTNKFKAAIADFINFNHTVMYDIAPYDIVYHTRSHIAKLFDALGIQEVEVEYIMRDCFFYGIPYNPPAIKEPYVVVCLCAISYFVKNKRPKDAELTTVYLLFSGKFYASLFTGVVFPKAPPSKYRNRMDYVVNTMLNNKNLLKSEGTLFGAFYKTGITWLDTYNKLLSGKPTDEEWGMLCQQLRDRERSLLMNVAKLYYEAKDSYINYETDNLSDTKEFRITENDSNRATKYTNNTVQYLVTNSISLKICNNCKDENIKATEVKDIMESIVKDKNNIDTLYRIVNILICDFLRYYPNKGVNSVDFISHSCKLKPNTKDKYILELYKTIVDLLNENSPNYRRRKSRKATDISYRKAILMYFSFAITYANRQ